MKKCVNKALFDLSFIEFKVSLVILVSFSIAILIAGTIKAIKEVPREDAVIEGIDENTFKSAEDLFEDNNGWQFYGYEQIRKNVVAYLENQENLFSFLNAGLKGKFIILQNTQGGLIDQKTQSIIDLKRKAIQDEIDALNKKIEDAYWGDRYEFERVRKEWQRKLDLMDRELKAINDMKFTAETKLIYAEDLRQYTYWAGQFDGINPWRGDDLKLIFTQVRPVLDEDFLLKHGVPKEFIDYEKIKSDRDEFKETKKRYGIKIKNELKRKQELIDSEVDPKRERIRDIFNFRWLPVLMNILGIYFAIRLLYNFYGLIRRKSVQGKSTETIYYATNTTSKLLRIIALIVVSMSMASLGIQALFSLLSGFAAGAVDLNVKLLFLFFSFLSLRNFFSSDHILVLMLIAFLIPIVQSFLTIIAAWLWVLWSEFVCFISNLYHIIFLKAYNDQVPKDQ